MSKNPQALWHLNDKESAIRPATSGTEGVWVKALFSMISTGTERLVATRGVPPTLYQQMEVPFMEGEFGLPIKYGYSMVGQVAAPGHALDQQIVHLLHPHQDEMRVPTASLTVVPDSVPPQRAILASNMETALNAVWDSGVSVGDKVLLMGFGNVGSLLARMLQGIPGLELTVWDLHPERQALARQLGFHIDAPEKGYDLAFNTTGHEEALQQCIQTIGYEGKVVELSWYGTGSIALHLGTTFHIDRKQLISSQVSRIPTDRLHRWDYARRKQAVFRLLADPAYDEHLTDWISFGALPDWFHRLRTERQMGGLVYGVSYGSTSSQTTEHSNIRE